ncbi:MAG: hypothetical protein IKC05_04965 [Lentisphaeria bacterium]|nr:hypothetical protein [Lentisphaeria bacterium]
MIALLILLTVSGRMTFFAFLYIGYLLYLFAKLIALIVKDTKSRILKYFSAFVLCFGLAPGFAIGVIPLWFISVVHLQNNPEIKQNIPEYKTWNTTLRNASFFNSYTVTAWEGEIKEKDFLAMAKRNSWDIKPLDKPFILDHYASGLIRQYQEKKAGRRVVPQAVDVADGYSFNRRQSNGGGTLVVWDKLRQKVYIISNPR